MRCRILCLGKRIGTSFQNEVEEAERQDSETATGTLGGWRPIPLKAERREHRRLTNRSGNPAEPGGKEIRF